MVKIELEAIFEEIRSLGQEVARLEKTIAREGSKLEGLPNRLQPSSSRRLSSWEPNPSRSVHRQRCKSIGSRYANLSLKASNLWL